MGGSDTAYNWTSTDTTDGSLGSAVIVPSIPDRIVILTCYRGRRWYLPYAPRRGGRLGAPVHAACSFRQHWPVMDCRPCARGPLCRTTLMG
jgi:hypothetical protein